MRHLNPETLARLVDEEARGSEREHLERCPRCAEALRELSEQTEALGSLPEIRPPTGEWREIESRLKSEGLIRERGAGEVRSARGRLRIVPASWMRAAAAIVLFVAGTGFGALIANADPAERVSIGRGSSPSSAPTTVPESPQSMDEAVERLRDAEDRYMDALLTYRSLMDADTGGGSPPDATGRFAALETLMAAGQAAIREAPADPFLNGILASTRAEQQAVLRQISAGDAGDWF